jgi:hypothetical protein
VDFLVISEKVDYHKHFFKRVSKLNLIFNVKLFRSGLGQFQKVFFDFNLEDISKCFYLAYTFDCNFLNNRRRKLLNVVKSIFDQNDYDVMNLMVKAIVSLHSQGLAEYDIIDKITYKILPFSGFHKVINEDKRYIWVENKIKKIKKDLRKPFIIKYIKSGFNIDQTYLWVKKNCFLRDGVWKFKNTLGKKRFFKDYKLGGILETPEDTKFEAFIPLSKSMVSSLLAKVENEDEKYPIISGLASDTKVDRDDERVSEFFIKKMKTQVKGLPITDNTHYIQSSSQTIGVVTKSSGEADELVIEAKLMKRSESESVNFILNQMATGINYGFSIGGRITKIFREYNEALKKEVYVLADGDLFHVCLTTQPANNNTFAQAMSKCISENRENIEKSSFRNTDKIYKHTSIMKNTEPSSIEEKDLPAKAFVFEDKVMNKSFPHHFVEDDILYLHKGYLLKAYKKAVDENTSEYVKSHLMNHLLVVGMNKQVREIQSEVKNLEGNQIETETVFRISMILKTLFSELKSMKKRPENLSDVIDGVGNEIDNLLKFTGE